MQTRSSQIFFRLSLLGILSWCLVLGVEAVGQTPAELQRATKLFEQANLKYSSRRYDEAIADYTEYIKIRPAIAAAWYNRGLAYYYRSLDQPTEAGYRQAAADFSEAIRLDSRQADYWYSRGRVHLKLMVIDFQRSRDRGLADFSQALLIEPRHAGAFRERGTLYEFIGKTREAKADLDEAIKLDPTDAVAYYKRSKVHGLNRNYAAARSDAETAIRLVPGYEVAKIYLDYIKAEAEKARTSTAIAPNSRTGPSRQRANVPPAQPKSGPVASAAQPITTAAQGFNQAVLAESAGNHPLVIEFASQTLRLIPMTGKTETRDSLMFSIFISTLHMRAKANSALGKHAESDADLELITRASIDETTRKMRASTAELDRDRSASGAGLIMSTLQSGYATTACTTGYEITEEWRALAKRLRPNDSGAALKAAISLMGMREICVTAHIMHAGNQAGTAILNRSDANKRYSEALETLKKAVAMMPQEPMIYRERAAIYRKMGRADLAAADEQKVRELSVRK